MQAFLREVTGLSPQNEEQQFLKAQILQITKDLAQGRFQIYVQGSNSLPTPFLLVVMLWLVILFTGYGLIAPRNPTVLISLFVCTLSVAGALFLIEELADPFNGQVRISSAPFLQVRGQLGQ